jgi:hypothetical protein
MTSVGGVEHLHSKREALSSVPRTIKKNEIMSFSGKWVKLESMLYEISQIRKTRITCFLSYVKSGRKKRRHESRRGLLGKGLGTRQRGNKRGEQRVNMIKVYYIHE